MTNVVLLSIPMFILLIVLEVIVDLIKGKGKYRLNDGISNLSAGLIHQLFGFVPKALMALSYVYVYQNWGLFKGTFDASSLWLWPALFLLVDFQYYWFHRWSHRVSFLWSGHVVHHQSEEYNLTVALRQSILQSLYSIPFNLVFALLGVHYSIIIVVFGLNTISQFWIHTQYIKKLPAWLEFFLNTPSHHRVHHGRNHQYIDKNYAGAFIIWDKMFGTFEPEEEPVIYGITVPPKTWNPFYDQFSTLASLCKRVAGYSTIDGLKAMILPPGWVPGEGEIHPEFNPRPKFNPVIERSRQILAATSFILGLIAVLFFLIRGSEWGVASKITSVVGACLLLFASGFLLDGKREQAESNPLGSEVNG